MTVGNVRLEKPFMPTMCFVGQVADLLDCNPKDITDLFYRGLLDDTKCPLLGNRRCIPLDYVETIGEILRRRKRAGE
jgi:hypothetical protein